MCLIDKIMLEWRLVEFSVEHNVCFSSTRRLKILRKTKRLFFFKLLKMNKEHEDLENFQEKMQCFYYNFLVCIGAQITWECVLLIIQIECVHQWIIHDKCLQIISLRLFAIKSHINTGTSAIKKPNLHTCKSQSLCIYQHSACVNFTSKQIQWRFKQVSCSNTPTNTAFRTV